MGSRAAPLPAGSMAAPEPLILNNHNNNRRLSPSSLLSTAPAELSARSRNKNSDELINGTGISAGRGPREPSAPSRPGEPRPLRPCPRAGGARCAGQRLPGERRPREEREGANPALCPLTAAARSMGKAEAAEPARQAGRRRGGSAARG